MQIVNTVVDKKLNLIGFVVKGNASELGEFGSQLISKTMSLEALRRMRTRTGKPIVFRTASRKEQLTFDEKGRILVLGDFKLSDLPMILFTENNEHPYKPVNNSIEIVKRYVVNNQNSGFDLKFDGLVVHRVSYSNTIAYTNYFKPSNFIVKTSKTNKVYITGKNGVKLEDIPSETIGVESTAKRTRSNAQDSNSDSVGLNSSLSASFDIIDIYNYIGQVGGSVIKLPSEKYKSETVDNLDKVDDVAGFKSLNIGEVASAYPIFNPVNLKVSSDFKKVGMATVDFGGGSQELLSFTHRTKSIFSNGENKMSKFGIAVPEEREAQLLKLLGGSLALSKITNNKVIEPLSKVIDTKSLVVYEVDASKIGLISDKKKSESILNGEQLVALLQEQYILNIFTKAFGTRAGMLKEFKETYGDAAYNAVFNKKLFGVYSLFEGNDKALATLKEAGIDPYSGAFDSTYVAAKNGVQISAKTADASDDDSLTVEYSLDGYNISKITYKVVKEAALKNDTKLVPETIIKTFNQVYNMESPAEKILAAMNIYKEAEKQLNELKKKLWLHSASMYLQGGKIKVHMHDSNKWTESKKLKTGTVYEYTGASANGLKVKLAGVEI